MIGVRVTYPEQLGDISFGKEKPVVLLRPDDDLRAAWHLAAPSRYRAWLRSVLWDVRKRGMCAVPEIPVTFFGTLELTDAVVDYFLGIDEPKKTVWALHLTRGVLKESDYVLRVFSLLRKGLAYTLVIDTLNGAGEYRDLVQKASFAEVVTRPCWKTNRMPCIFSVATWGAFMKSYLLSKLDRKIRMCVVDHKMFKGVVRWMV